jgi:hypothetical protein
MTKRVKTNLAGTTVEIFINKCEKYLLSLKKELFSVLQDKVTGLEQKIARMKELQMQVIEGSHKAVVMRNELRKDITREVSRLCDWINVHAHDNEAYVQECAFEKVKPRTSATAPAGIRKLAVYRSSQSGKAEMKWKGNGAKFYRAQMTVNPESEHWKDVASVTSTRCEVENLPVGTFCYFRVQGVNSAGPGAFSEVYVYMAS